MQTQPWHWSSEKIVEVLGNRIATALVKGSERNGKVVRFESPIAERVLERLTK